MRYFARLGVRSLVAVVAIGLVSFAARWVWMSKGGRLPPVTALRVGMTKGEVGAIVGPWSFGGQREDGSSYEVITRSESFYWLEFNFNPAGRLRSFRKECF
jgi:hypothetical protein